MGTIKIIGFDEQGQAQRLKIRIARILDYDPVTSTEKENIRDSLGVDDSLSGTFTTPLSVTSASDSSFTGGGNVTVSGGVTTLNNSGDNALRVESTNGNPMTINVVGSAQNYLLDIRDDGTSKFRVDGSGKVGIGTGTATPARQLHVKGNGTLSQFESTSTSAYLSLLESGGNHTYLGNAVGDFVIQTASGGYSSKLVVYNGGNVAVPHGNLVMSSGGIDFGSVAGGTGTPATNGGLLDDFETGIFSPSFSTTGTGFTTVDIIYSNAVYTKIGNCVTFSIYLKTREIDATGATGNLCISNLPFAARSDSGNYSGAVNVGFAHLWTNAPEGGYIGPGASRIQLTKRVTSITGSLSECVPTDMTTGVNTNHNQIMVSGHYYTA